MKIKTLDTAKRTTSKQVSKSISDFLNVEYKSYAHYVAENRACPSFIDGCKVGARKILHSAFHGSLKNGEEKKLLNLVGDVYALTYFPHGDTSLVGTALTMGAAFSDNLPTLEIVGQGGTLRDTNASAARYLSCKLSKYAKMLYKVDEDLLSYVFDEGEYLEPDYYLPIIPTILCTRTEGMAPGYKYASFYSCNPITVIDACMEVIKNGKIKTQLTPYVNGIKPENFKYEKETGRWYNVGEYTIDEKNYILRITDLPYDVTYEKLEKKLNSYVDSEYIKDWKDYSQDGKIDYRVLFADNKELKDLEKIQKKFLLITYIPNDLLYTVDENKKIKHFADKYELLTYFVQFRLNKYNDRKDKLVDIKKKQLKDNEDLCKFIELVTSGKIKINNRKRSDIKTDLDKYGLNDSLLSISISKLTEEEKNEILKRNEEIKQELEYIKNTTIETMYLNDLKDLRKKLAPDFL